MTTPRSTARKLTTDTEYRLIEESFAPSVTNLDAKSLGKRIERTRRLRDKYRRQAEGRRREIRGKAAQRRKAPARSNTLSVAKQKLFEETLARFEKCLARRDKGRGHPRRQSDLAKAALAMKKAAKPAGQRPSSRTAGSGMKSNPASGPKGYFPAPGARKGELSAAVKRGQARRDSRG